MSDKNKGTTFTCKLSNLDEITVSDVHEIEVVEGLVHFIGDDECTRAAIPMHSLVYVQAEPTA